MYHNNSTALLSKSNTRIFGFLIALVGLLLVVFLWDAPKASAAVNTCASGGDSSWVQANVTVLVRNYNGAVIGAGGNYTFNITSGLGRSSAQTYNSYQREKRQMAAHQEARVSAGKPVRKPNGNNYGSRVDVTAVQGNMHQCGSYMKYDLTNGTNGNYFLDCLAGIDVSNAGDDMNQMVNKNYANGNNGTWEYGGGDDRWNWVHFTGNFTFTPTGTGPTYYFPTNTATPTALPGPGRWTVTTPVTFAPTDTETANHINEKAVTWEYQLDPPPTLSPNVKLDGGGATDIEAGDTATPSAWITGSGSATANWTWQFWYEGNGDTSINNAQDARIQGADKPGNSGVTPGLSGYSGIVVDGSKKIICTKLTLAGQNPGYAVISNNPAVICKKIIRKPYVSIQNGDINTTCNNGTVKAFWSTVANGGRGNGSGTQLAVYAGGAIDGFVSALGRSSDPLPLKGLTFSNSGSGFGSPLTGVKVGLCSKPLATDMPDSALGSQSLGGLDVSNKGTMYIKGDLTITDNLTYGSTTGLSMTNIPYFKVIVSGNIYISSTVSRLDGVYQAGGTIYTCTNNGGRPALNPALVSACNNRLTVNGSLEADSIKYLRFAGSTLDTATGPAETVIYDPLSWVHALRAPVSGQLNASKFDAYTTMPPIL